MAWAPAQNIGDVDALIPRAKVYLRRFSYGRDLGETTEYTAAFGVALRQWQANTQYQIDHKGQRGPSVNQAGVFDWAVKTQMGLLDMAPTAAPPTPWIITIAGFLGDMFTGPAYFTARELELRGLARVQPIGYDNTRLPFRVGGGVTELHRVVTEVIPKDAPWAILAHSMGAIVACDYLEQTLLPAKARGEAAFVNYRGGIHFGNPRRPMGEAAPWIVGNDRPAADTEGLDPVCLTAPVPGVAEVSRRGDLYAEKRRDTAGDHKAAVYQAVARGDFTGRNSLTEQIGEIVTDFGPGMWSVFQAITGGVQFLINMDPHNVFDLRPCIEHTEAILR